ncbi:hypothetical protein BKA65DRAFT_388141, partial [Rhexocercosporidium sp. MPI-PUGE-AT-0058]
KFRILIIGGTGVGKSTICSKHNINTPWTFPGLNKRIVIHNSKGFEKGEQKTFNKVAEFIKARRETAKLADQLHCIWYCISCEDDVRPVQQIEEDFFRNLDVLVGKIPVIVVFTKYDKIIGKRYAGWWAKNRNRHAKGEISDQAMYEEIRTAANVKFKKLVSEQWSRVINPLSVPSLRMANLGEKRNDVGVEQLTRMTLDNLENHNIKILWATAQNNSANLTSEQSIAVAMEYFGFSMGFGAIPLLPLVSGITFWKVYTSAFSSISPLWNIVDSSNLLFKHSTRKKFLEAIFDTNTWAFLLLQSMDVLGPLDAPATATVLAKAVAGIVLLHDILWVIQKEQWGTNKAVTSLSERQSMMLPRSSGRVNFEKLRYKLSKALIYLIKPGQKIK